MVTHMGQGVLIGHPRHCICTNASRGLSLTAEFLARRLAYVSMSWLKGRRFNIGY